MSFQDVGRPGYSRSQPKKNGTLHSVTNQSSGMVDSEDNRDLSFSGSSAVSDSILKYQRHVVILEKVTEDIGTESDGHVLQTEYAHQVDVIKKLGYKIEKLLKGQELHIQSLSRTDAARSRATHLKLARDFRSVELAF